MPTAIQITTREAGPRIALHQNNHTPALTAVNALPSRTRSNCNVCWSGGSNQQGYGDQVDPPLCHTCRPPRTTSIQRRKQSWLRQKPNFPTRTNKNHPGPVQIRGGLLKAFGPKSTVCSMTSPRACGVVPFPRRTFSEHLFCRPGLSRRPSISWKKRQATRSLPSCPASKKRTSR